MRCKDTTLFSNNKEFFKKKYRNHYRIAILYLKPHSVPVFYLCTQESELVQV